MRVSITGTNRRRFLGVSTGLPNLSFVGSSGSGEITGFAFPGETLSMKDGAWGYQWFVNSDNRGTARTLVLTWADVGKTVTGIRNGVVLPTRIVGVADADLEAHRVATEATDLEKLNDLTAYLKAQSLFTSSRFYTMKSSQNFGSGSTVRGLGGLGTSDFTLVNSPTWGATGIDLGATQYMDVTLANVGAAANALIFVRQAPTLASAADNANALLTALGNYRNTTPTGTGGAIMSGSTSLTSGEIESSQFAENADTSDPGRRLGTTGGTWTAGENHTRVYQLASTGHAIWKNKTSLTLDRNNVVTASYACGPTNLGTTDGYLVVGGRRLNGATSASGGRGTVTAYLVIAGASLPTLAQREAITDLLNAL